MGQRGHHLLFNRWTWTSGVWHLGAGVGHVSTMQGNYPMWLVWPTVYAAGGHPYTEVLDTMGEHIYDPLWIRYGGESTWIYFLAIPQT